jgi:hypothetical protein
MAGEAFHQCCVPLFPSAVFEGTVVTFEDIMERIKTKEALLESEAPLASIFELMGTGVAV